LKIAARELFVLYLLSSIAFLIVAANLYATFIVIRSPLSERAQKLWQLAFVWLLPFIGASFVISILEEQPRSYLFNPRHSVSWKEPGEMDDVNVSDRSSD
jgi:hypothetical protein